MRQRGKAISLVAADAMADEVEEAGIPRRRCQFSEKCRTLGATCVKSA
jgi:hypothetical protein